MSDPFYAQGLRFSCTRCSRCCRHDPGFVFLTRADLSRLVRATGLPARQFVERYCRQVGLGGFHRLSLKEKDNYDCVFWEEAGCTVYEHRPHQCRSYPFWAANLHSPERWEALKRSCPGVGQGSLHTRESIDAWLERSVGDSFLSTIAEALR